MHGPPETEVSPAPQSKQLGLPTVEDCPAGQFAQPVASELLANCPGTHSAHWCLLRRGPLFCSRLTCVKPPLSLPLLDPGPEPE